MTNNKFGLIKGSLKINFHEALNFWFAEPKTHLENIYKCMHLHIFLRCGYGNVKYVKIIAMKLYKFYNKKNWIHDVDEIYNLYQ